MAQTRKDSAALMTINLRDAMSRVSVRSLLISANIVLCYRNYYAIYTKDHSP